MSGKIKLPIALTWIFIFVAIAGLFIIEVNADYHPDMKNWCHSTGRVWKTCSGVDEAIRYIATRAASGCFALTILLGVVLFWAIKSKIPSYLRRTSVVILIFLGCATVYYWFGHVLVGSRDELYGFFHALVKWV